MKRFFKHIKPYWIFFALSPILMIFEVFCDVQIPTLSAEIINLGITNYDNAVIIKIALKMVLTLCVAASCGIGASYCATRASANFCHDVREEVFTKIQDFSFLNIDKFSTGSLVTRLTNDITQVGDLVVMCLRMMFRAPGMLIGAIVMAYAISPSLSLIFVVLAPILVVIISIILYFAFPKFAQLQKKVDALNTNIQEGLINIRVIKAFTREKHEEKRFTEVNEDLKNTSLKAYRINILQTPLMTMAVNLSTIAILWFGSKAVSNSDILIGDVSALITYLAQILMAVSSIANIFMQFSRSFISVRRLAEVLDENVDISDLNVQSPEKTVDSGSIEFKNVCFKYFKDSQDNVLNDISLKIESGQTVGIVGSTGSGKSSFVHLIARLYDVTSGSVLVDGVDVKQYNLHNLREGVAMVLQQNLLFSGTIKENLLWGKVDASDDELVLISDYAAAHEFIKDKEDGYNTVIDQGGLNLSGGQKQRLCIARALMKQAKILILDDSTSAVDSATELKIRHHFEHDLKDMTKLIIAQRISSVMHSDMIIVLNDGEISDVGTHKELLQHSHVYREIYRSQMDNGDTSLKEEVSING